MPADAPMKFEGDVTLPREEVFELVAWLAAFEEMFATIEGTGEASVGADYLEPAFGVLEERFGMRTGVSDEEFETDPVRVELQARVHEKVAQMLRTAARLVSENDPSVCALAGDPLTERSLRLHADSADLEARRIREAGCAYLVAPGLEEREARDAA